MNHVPLPEASLPALDALINGSLWRTWAERDWVLELEDVRASVGYVRLKPGSCRLTVFSGKCGTVDDPPPGFLLRLFADLRRARAAFRKESARQHLVGNRGHRPFLCEASSVLALPFPADPELRELGPVHEPGRLRRTLAEALPAFPVEEWRVRKRGIRTELLAYKPGRRAVYRLRVALQRRADRRDQEVVLHAKLADPETIARSRARLEALIAARPARADWWFACPLGATRHMLACEWIEGRSVLSLVDGADPAAADALARTGRAIAGLHALKARLDWECTPFDDGARLRLVTADLARWMPGSASRIRALGDRIAALTEQQDPGRSTPIHGDLHLGQALISGSGTYLVDLDRARRGHPAHDLGRVQSHLLEERAPADLGRAFLEGYSSVAAPPSEASLRIGTAANLLRRAVLPLRNLDPDWPQEILRRLNLAEELVG